ncbi:MAG: response regulator transcription factor [Luteimonas sp.]
MTTRSSTRSVGRQALGLRILIVEDQRDIAANIWDFLERRGYVVDHAVDGQTGLTLSLRGGFDVIVLDLGLPRLDGLDLCRRLRATGNGVPVLMLTARDTLEDRLRGFAEGADDYLVKPFAMRELEARIQALHRRGRPAVDRQMQVGDLSYDPRSMLASHASGQLALTRAQGQLLMALMNASPAVVPHRDLLHAVWGEEGGDIAALHTHVYDLRVLLGGSSQDVAIQSVRGFGYRLVARP